jgi:hypothetical protein
MATLDAGEPPAYVHEVAELIGKIRERRVDLRRQPARRSDARSIKSPVRAVLERALAAPPSSG